MTSRQYSLAMLTSFDRQTLGLSKQLEVINYYMYEYRMRILYLIV